ncbi:DUF4337 domain-containing protein [Herbaspirillum sp. YR522]|uniref:DUF4337 domain-containing protein n=1 Tax=Herbaspirillum sp. YR522 TaxID=1144342 RepID=UPI00026F9A21|nr:DUF4337 domain-containing protein [Herbaspirillum sp. YR522]EJN00908.1 hypothetical protein PMI40_03490 [Herbaspirillum sp. YR522]
MSEATEHLEHAEHAHASGNKKLALLIAILALVLAITETLSKSYQTEVILKHQEAANLWAFFQAKSIRGNSAQLAKTQLGLLGDAKDERVRAAIAKLDDTVAHYEDDEKSGEGKKQLAHKARDAEHEAHAYMEKYEKLEMAAGMLQVAIVLASATIITAVGMLAWLSMGIGVVALGFVAMGIVGAV